MWANAQCDGRLGGALCLMSQTLADAHYLSATWYQDAKSVEICWGAPNVPTDLSC